MASSDGIEAGLGEVVALLRQGAVAEAGARLDTLRRAAPGDVRVHQLLAQRATRLGDAGQALRHMEDAHALAPSDPDVRRQLALLQAHAGTTLGAAGRTREALAALRRAHGLVPGDRSIRRALADLEFRAGWPADALPHWQALLADDPGDATARLRTGETLHRLGDQAAAVACYREGVRRHPGDAGLWLALGQATEDAGDRDAARGAYTRALALRPDWPFALGCLLGLLRADAPDAAVDRATALLDGTDARPAPDDGDRSLLGYALGKVLEARGAHDGAMARWQDANSARRRVAGEPDPAAIERRVDALVAAHPAGVFDAAPASPAAADDRFVFVVGMPRSGTTLTEQILASHPAAHGCGELPDMTMLQRRFGDAPATPGAVAECVARFTAAATRHAPAGARRLVDKEPLDFLNLGLVARLFPRARVVWCRRDPRDVATSIFGENFALDEPWATRLDAIGHFILAQDRLMRHWQAVLPLPILAFGYEDLVEAPEAQARRLVEFAGLPWDPACLAFHAHARAVQSPSRWQVREPVHARSVGRWRRHADALAPLVEVLTAGGMRLPD